MMYKQAIVFGATFLSCAFGQSDCQVQLINEVNAIVTSEGAALVQCQADVGFTFLPPGQAPTTEQANQLCGCEGFDRIFERAKTFVATNDLASCELAGVSIGTYLDRFETACEGTTTKPPQDPAKCTRSSYRRN